MRSTRSLLVAAVAAGALASGLGTATAPSAEAVPSTAESVTVAWYDDFLQRLLGSDQGRRATTDSASWITEPRLVPGDGAKMARETRVAFAKVVRDLREPLRDERAHPHHPGSGP